VDFIMKMKMVEYSESNHLKSNRGRYHLVI